MQKSSPFKRVWSSHAQDRLPSIRKLKQSVDAVDAPSEYEKLQELIKFRTGVRCSILVGLDKISIRADSYPEYLLAKKALQNLKGTREIVYCP